MLRRTAFYLAAAILVPLILSLGVSAEEFQYTGVRDCSRCHKKELIGDQYKAWKKSKHSDAFKTLQSDKAVKIAQERGMTEPPHESDACLRCHATAHGVTAEQVEKGPLRLSDGVQCESCHGPGSGYKSNEVMSDQKQALAAGLWQPGKDEGICTACHNDESPTFTGFDYEERKQKIAHPIPADVKGRYLELEEAKGSKRRRE